MTSRGVVMTSHDFVMVALSGSAAFDLIHRFHRIG